MKREIPQYILRPVQNILETMNPEDIYYFNEEDSRKKGYGGGWCHSNDVFLTCAINAQSSLEEQGITLIHEAVHITLTKLNYDTINTRKRKVERKIDGISKMLFDKSEIKKIVLNLLKQSKKVNQRIYNYNDFPINKAIFKRVARGVA